MKRITILLITFFLLKIVAYASFPVSETSNIVIEECDNIILKDGNEISAKIIEITPDLVKYKKCGQLDGPMYTIYKSDILMLRYADGTKDIIRNNKKYKNQEYSEETNRLSSLGFLSILSGIYSWFVLGVVFAPLGIIFGIISLVRDENKVAGAIGLSISSIALIILLIALSL